MKKILLILLLFIVGCEIESAGLKIPSETREIEVPSAEITSLTTEKELFHSGENIKISLNVNSRTELNATVRFYGINSRDRNKLDQSLIADFVEGKNKIEFDYDAPNCYGCSGISPGTYQINADIIYGNETLATETIDVELRQ